MEGNGRGLILRFFPSIYPEEMRKTNKSLNKVADRRVEIRTEDLRKMRQTRQALDGDWTVGAVCITLRTKGKLDETNL